MSAKPTREMSYDENIYETPEYQEFVDECSKRCRCSRGVCDGVLAGGFCDEIIEDEPEHWDEEE